MLRRSPIRNARPLPTTSPSAFGMWTREPCAGAVLHLAGFSESIIRLDNKKERRADQLVRFLGPDLDSKVRDSVIAEITASRDDNTRDPHISRWLLSNERVDSYDSTLAWSGWDLPDFKRNPTVLLAHDSDATRSLPIGEDVGVYMDPARKALMGITRYVSQELAGRDSLEARAVRWVIAGFLRAVSVGFEPIEYQVAEERDDGQSWFVPMDFKRQALKEYSVVPVPANPDALGEGRGFANMTPQDVEMFAQDIERSLDGAGWLAVPRAQLEQMRTALRGTRMQIDLGGEMFIVGRAADMGSNGGDMKAGDGNGEADGEGISSGGAMDKCPACGYKGLSSEFDTASPDATVEDPSAEEQQKAAALSTAALVLELRKRHAKLDSQRTHSNADADDDVSAAQVAVEVLEAVEAIEGFEAGRLP